METLLIITIIIVAVIFVLVKYSDKIWKPIKYCYKLNELKKNDRIAILPKYEVVIALVIYNNPSGQYIVLFDGNYRRSYDYNDIQFFQFATDSPRKSPNYPQSWR